MKNEIEIIIIIILFGIFIGSGYGIGYYFYQGYVQSEKFRTLSSELVPERENETVVADGNEILAKYEKLYKKNHDLAGWIEIEGTKINYPVMQTKDDYQYYLKRNFEKNSSIYGTPFIGENCEIAPRSDNIVIYGHNMKNGSMFAQLNKYTDFEFYKKHNIVNFDTLYETAQYEIAYVFISEVNVKDAFEYYKYTDWKDKAEFNSYLATLETIKLYDTGVKISNKDQIITLSTCENRNDNSRMVVIAKKIE